MPNFLFIYRGQQDPNWQPSPDEIQQIMQKWMDWINQGFQQGWMIDAGDALKPEGKVVKSGKVVTDGPFVESKEVVGGYSVIRADSFEKAAEHAHSCPALHEGGGSVEIREMAGLAPPKE